VPTTRPEILANRADLARQIGVRLAAARTKAGISQEAAAAELGVAQSAIAKIEAGRRYVSFLEAADLAALFGISLSDLDPRGDSGRTPLHGQTAGQITDPETSD
jgi:transcriptional regulator with XRE-family HTH domain